MVVLHVTKVGHLVRLDADNHSAGSLQCRAMGSAPPHHTHPREEGERGSTNPGLSTAVLIVRDVHVVPAVCEGQAVFADIGEPHVPGVEGGHERVRVKLREGHVEYQIIPGSLGKLRGRTRSVLKVCMEFKDQATSRGVCTHQSEVKDERHHREKSCHETGLDGYCDNNTTIVVSECMDDRLKVNKQSLLLTANDLVNQVISGCHPRLVPPL